MWSKQVSFSTNKDHQAAKQAAKPIVKKCARCGEEFQPMNHRFGSGTARKYCYDPECETAREREKVQKYKSKKKEAN